LKKCITALLVLVLSVNAMAAAIGSTSVSEHDGMNGAVPQNGTIGQSSGMSTDGRDIDPVMEYLSHLDVPGPVFPAMSTEEGPSLGDGMLPIQSDPYVDAILLHEDSSGPGVWYPLPTRADLQDGSVAPVTFENGTQVEIHGKLFENALDVTYLDDVGIADMTITISFDGTQIPGGVIDRTGNSSTRIDPFGVNGNGTFQFILDVNKPAGEYELQVYFAGWPLTGDKVYEEMTYKAIVYVNHPTIILMDDLPGSVTVGESITVSGSVADDTGRPVTNVPLNMRLDNVLIGPTSDGVYIDDVEVLGEGFSDDFEAGSTKVWTSYTVPDRGVGDQWEQGSLDAGFGPSSPHSGSQLWGTVLDGNYQRGAWCYLVSPQLDFTADQTYTLSFWAWWSVPWNDDYAYVLVTDDGGTTWDEANPLMFMDTRLASGGWASVNYDVSMYKGSDNVRFAFVFYSVDKTTDVQTDSTFSYELEVPMSTEADLHRVTVQFAGNLLFRRAETHGDITVKRTTHFEFEENASLKVGHRNEPVKLVAHLKDNMGEVPSAMIRGLQYLYQVTIYWDKTWRIDDGIGMRVGPPRTMNRDTGETSINYIVDHDQALGPANVTFRFPGSDYYAPVDMTDVYYVKAEVYFSLSDEQVWSGPRGQNAEFQGELRVVPSQSIYDMMLGDPVSGEFISIYWNAVSIGMIRTRFDGAFSGNYTVPTTHPVGEVPIVFEYLGQSRYDPAMEHANFTVKSAIIIALEDQKVFKGPWFSINGTVKDDLGQPVADMLIFIIWERAPEIGRITTGADGTFSLQHNIAYLAQVGEATVIARYLGSKLYAANETWATYTVMAHTVIERLDQTVNFTHGNVVEISGEVHELWGDTRGVAVQRASVRLLIDDIVVNIKRSAFNGSFTFAFPIDPALVPYGEVDLVLELEGIGFYQSSRNTTRVVIRGTSIITFTEFRVNGDLYDPLTDVVYKDQETHGRVLVQGYDYAPITSGLVSIYYREEGEFASDNLVQSGITDAQGYFEFNWTLRVDTIGTIIYIAKYEGLTADTFMMEDDLIILPTERVYSINYSVHPPGNVTDLDAQGEKGTIVLTWTAPAAEGRASATGYRVYRGTSENDTTLLVELGNVLTYVDEDVREGRTYYYRVVATSDFGESEPSHASDAKVKKAENGPGFGIGTLLAALCATSVMMWRRRSR
jgi:hypothetical protein